MKTDYLYPNIADRRSISVWEDDGSKDAREVARSTVRTLLADYYPSHIDAATDARIRDHYNIILPTSRMRAGNGAW